MIMKLGLAVLGAALVLQGGAVDVGHYDPDARRKAFVTEIDWSLERLEAVVNGEHHDLLPLFGEGLAGQVQWELSVRDSPRFEDGKRVFVMRDYEDVILRAELAEDSRLIGMQTQAALEVFGGMERERVSFRRMRDADESGSVDRRGEWSLELPKESELKEAGLLGLQPWVDLVAFAPREGLDVGDSWKVPAAHLEELLFPVGHPATLLAPMGWAKVADVDVPLGGALDSVKGPVEVTVLEHNEAEAWTRMELEIDSELVMTPQAALAALGQVYVDGREFETSPLSSVAQTVEGEFRVAIKGTGQLVWSHELHAFESLELPLDFTSTLELSFELGVLERTFEIQAEADSEGEMRLEYSRD
jgi:hypothetical protein